MNRPLKVNIEHTDNLRKNAKKEFLLSEVTVYGDKDTRFRLIAVLKEYPVI
jgi:hypothetical protein